MQLIADAARFTAGPTTPADYVEYLRAATLSVGTYSIAAGAPDDQGPHDEDEVYVVLTGRGRFTGGEATVEVGPGSTIFVPAAEEHRFHDVTEDLTVVVLFAPPYSGD